MLQHGPFWHSGSARSEPAHREAKSGHLTPCFRAMAVHGNLSQKPAQNQHPIISYRTVLARWPGWESSSVTKGPPPEQKAHLQADALKKAAAQELGRKRLLGPRPPPKLEAVLDHFRPAGTLVAP